MSDSQQVKHGVGRPAESHHDGDGVLEGGLGHDVARVNAAVQEIQDRRPRVVGQLVAARIDRGNRRAAQERHTERFTHTGHGVGGKHARAASFARTGGALNSL